MMRSLVLMLAAGLAAEAAGAEAPEQAAALSTLRAVPFTAVRIADTFWQPRIETNRTRSVPHNLKWCRDTGRLSNFAKAGKLMEGGHEGIFFNDSDVYKVLEGAAYCLHAHPDPALEKEVDELIAWMAAAQQPDGYLNTYYVLKEPDRKWTNLRVRHELYCAGHLFEAAVAHYRATGKKTLLNVATRFADLIDGLFGPDKRHDVAGHEEIELALVKLAEATGEKRYLQLAKFFLDIRGRVTEKRPKVYGPYCQDHQPVVEQSEPTGHAVRAMYLYSGMADAAAATGDRAYVAALGRLWRNTVERKMYITGAIGSTRRGEAFGTDHELPNESAYGETCASIGMCLWNYRMFLLHGEGRFVDTFERTLYNGMLAGVDLGGEKYFYVNPLASRGRHHRQPFYGCACCPTNVVRFMPSLGGYVYALADGAVHVNLYVASKAKLDLDGGRSVTLTQETRYPWDGRVRIAVDPAGAGEFELRLRIPAWCVGRAGKDDLYQPAAVPADQRAATIAVNGGKLAPVEAVKGYARIRRAWRAGDAVELLLPMPIRRVYAHPAVEADRGRVALHRGPVVFCIEGVDNGAFDGLYLPRDAELTTEFRGDLLGGVQVVRAKAKLRCRADQDEPAELLAVPYYAWDHRQAGPMAVWIAEDRDLARMPPEPTAASLARAEASFAGNGDGPAALNDQIEPKNSNDHDIPRFTWWDHRGTAEWVQYTFDKPRRVAGVSVYWFDDKPRPGQCRVPKSWRLVYRDGEAWKPVAARGEYGTAIDRYNEVAFEPVQTDAIRIEVQLQPGFSGGILEWKVSEAGK